MTHPDPTEIERIAKGLTKARADALCWIVAHNGGGITKAGRVCCGGEVGHMPGRAFDPVTFLRLTADELVGGERGRIVPTPLGRLVAEKRKEMDDA